MTRTWATAAISAALGLVLAGWTAGAFAADVVFPKGVRVGLVPLEGMTEASTFPGFETTDPRVKVVVTELPKSAFPTVEAAAKASRPAAGQPSIEPLELESGAKAYMTRETASDNGSTVRRFSLMVGAEGFSGYVAVQVPDAPGGAYSDEAVRKMLSTITLRSVVPPEELLDRLPFKLGDTGGFKSVRTLATGTVLLTDAADEESLDSAPYMVIGLVADGPATPADRDRYAQEIVRTLPGLHDIRVTSSEPMRIAGTAGYETRVEATTARSNTPVRIVQWLRFTGNSTTLRIVAGAKRDDWQPAFTRFRAVRDAVGPRDAPH